MAIGTKHAVLVPVQVLFQAAARVALVATVISDISLLHRMGMDHDPKIVAGAAIAPGA